MADGWPATVSHVCQYLISHNLKGHLEILIAYCILSKTNRISATNLLKYHKTTIHMCIRKRSQRWLWPVYFPKVNILLEARSVTSSQIWFVTFQSYILVTYQQLISCLFLYIQKDEILFFFIWSLCICTKNEQLISS